MMTTTMTDIFNQADNNLNDYPTNPDNEMFPVKLVNSQRTKIPVIVDVHPLHTVETILEAARVDLGLGDAPLSEFTITCNGHSAKPSMTMKALGLHKGMVNGDNYPVLMIDSTAPTGGRI